MTVPPDKSAPPPGSDAPSQDIEGLVQRLPRDAALSLYQEIEREPSSPNRSVVHRALVDHLNGARRAHARRQFTQIFEAFLTRHDWQLQGTFAPPGAVHVMDIGGLWAVLAAKPLAALAREADAKLAELARNQPLAMALRLPEAVVLRDRLRKAASDYLHAQLAERSGGRDLVDAMNAWRRDDAAAKGWSFIPRPLTLTDLTLYLAILDAGAAYAPLVTAPVGHDQGEEVVANVLALNPPGVPTPTKALLGLLVPLARLNQKRAYEQLVAALIQGPAPWQPDLHAAMARHVCYVCHTIGSGLATLAGGTPVPGAPTFLSSRRPLLAGSEQRAVLERELSALDTLLSLLEEFDMLRDGREAGLARGALDDMVREIEGTLYPYLSTRLATVTQNHSRALSDEAALCWVLGYILRWRSVLTRTLHWGTRFTDFRDRLVEDLGDTFKAAYTDGFVAANARERLAHAGQAARLAAAIGVDLAASLTLLDAGVVTVSADRLRDSTPLTVEEELLLGTVVRLAAGELKRTRHWQDRELATLVEMGHQRGL